jgi:predicted esterase
MKNPPDDAGRDEEVDARMKAAEIIPNLFHVGPALDFGPLPSVFYFALSGPDSLCLDPFNQPVQFFEGKSIRIFSMTLPAHEEGLSPHHALSVWAENIAKGRDPLGPFFEEALKAIEYTVQQKLADPERLGIAGLSRGGLIASHLAAREERFKAILQFAPLTRVSQGKDFESVKGHPLLQTIDVFPLAKQLANRHIRFYIGNKDTRTHTKACFEFAMELVGHSTLRTPQIEFIMTPSIGQMGHGTSPEAFHQGAEWLAQCLI